MTHLFRINFPELQSCRKIKNLTVEDWSYLESAAGFDPRCGKLYDSIASDETGKLWIIDTCGDAYPVDITLAVAVKP